MPIVLNGATSGSTTLTPTDAVTATLTLPSATTTLVGVTTPSFTTTIGVGGATASASGAGISFPATQSASTDANTLDDYEEGTFTPTLTNTSGSLSYATQAGKYTKIGNIVVCVFWIQWSSGSLSGSTTYMSGLPFNSASGNQRPSPSVRTAGFTVTGVIGGWIPNSDSRIQINVYNNGGQNDVSGSSVNSSGEFGGTVVYQVA